jgi:hypothetical protein
MALGALQEEGDSMDIAPFVTLRARLAMPRRAGKRG